MGTPELIANAPSYDTVRSSVLNILKKKIIVGHGMEHDFEVLDYYPPAATIRDSAKYFKLGKTPSLKSLVDRYLDMQIQSGEHSSVEDAQAVMKLYLMFRDKWEAGRKAGAGSKKSGKKMKEINVSEVENVTKTLSQLSINKNKVVYSLKCLKSLPEDHVFSAEINQLMKGAGADQRKVMWAKQWLNRRRNKENFNKKFGVETSIQHAFNQLSNDQLKRWIQIYRDRANNKKSTVINQPKQNDQKVPKVFTYSFSGLKTLPRDHVFSADLNTLLKGKQNSLTRILWAEEWIKRRADKPKYDRSFNQALSIAQAFNVLSNKQLRKWIAMQKSKSNETSETASTPSKSSSTAPQPTYSFSGLKTLPKDHQFSVDLNTLLKGKENSLTRVLWAEEWIRRRKDRPEYPNDFDSSMLISDAFNLLSNKQLLKWIRIQTSKLNGKSKAVSASGETVSAKTSQSGPPKNKSKQKSDVGNFERLQFLPANHVFTEEDLNNLLRMSTKGADKSQVNLKAKESVRWGYEWLPRRKNKPDFVSYSPYMSLLEAFNNLSNRQLKIGFNTETKNSHMISDIL